MSQRGRIFVCFPVAQGAERVAHPNPKFPGEGGDLGLGAPGMWLGRSRL